MLFFLFLISSQISILYLLHMTIRTDPFPERLWGVNVFTQGLIVTQNHLTAQSSRSKAALMVKLHSLLFSPPSKHISSALSVTSPHPFTPGTHAFHTACCEKQACCVAQPWRQTLSRLQAAPPAPTVSPSPSPCSQMTYKTLASHTNLTLTARHELSNCAIES